MRLEAVGMRRAEVDAGTARGDQPGHGARAAGGVRDPEPLGQEEAAHVRRLAEQRVAVRGEREVPVEGGRDARAVQRREERARRVPGVLEVLGRELALRRLVPVGLALELGHVDRQRIVRVGADAVPVAALAEVGVAVLVAHDRVARLGGLAGQLGQRVRPGQQVLHRLHGDRAADQVLQLGAPDAAADEQRGGRDRALGRLDAAHAPAAHVHARDARQAVELRARGLAAAAQHVADGGRLAEAVAGHAVGREDRLRVEQRHERGGRGRIDDLAGQAVGGGVVAAPVQLGQALGRRRDLEAADAEPGALVEAVELAVEIHRPLRERAEQPRAVRLEDEPGRVERGAAGVLERPLVEHDHVAHAGLDEVVRRARADDARADHDHVGAALHAASTSSASSASSPPSPTSIVSSGRPSVRAAASAARASSGVGFWASQTTRR